MCAHGDSDQSGEHSGPVEPFQPVGVTKDSRMSARYGLRGVRVGEAKNTGPRRRFRRVSSEGSDPGPASVGAANHHDSSDDDAPFVLPGRRHTQRYSDEGNVARRDFSLPVPSTVPVSEDSLRHMRGGVEVFPLTNWSASSPLHESLLSERVPRTESEDTETVDSRGESESFVVQVTRRGCGS